MGNRSLCYAPHNIYRCAGDDEWCAIAVETDSQWRALCQVIGFDELLHDQSLVTVAGRLQSAERIDQVVSQWTLMHHAEMVMHHLQAAAVPAGKVMNARDLMENDEQLKHRGYWQTIDHPEIGKSRFTSPPYLLDGERVTLKRPPLLGEHSEDVLQNLLGYSSDQIQSLRKEGVLE